METYIRFDEVTHVVTFVHKRPFDSVHGLGCTREELLKTGTFVPEYPNPDSVPGKRAIAYYNPELKKVYYQYELVPATTAERCEMLEAAMNVILMGGGNS